MPPFSSFENNPLGLSEHSESGDSVLQMTKPLNYSRKSVWFQPTVEVHEIPSLDSLSHHEIRATWYSKFDFSLIRAEVQHGLSMLKEGKDDSFCQRGLEWRTPEGNRRRHVNKMCARNALLREQKGQLKINQVNPEALAKIYMDASRHCQIEAYTRAIEDYVNLGL